ncbi:helix-turn-helix domain-containing protein [Aquicoccus sp. SCR17]|nr:helix-turn-helix domain-containing protein [Carideicomes alvinocaridis]
MRTLEILEYCDSVQRAVTVSELVAQLGYPQSSTSVLIKSMVTAGYLTYDSKNRGVLPTSRVSLLGRWVQPALARPELKQLMQSLGEIIGQTIVLGVPHGIFIRYIDTEPGRLAMRLELPVGTRLPIVASGMGTMLLAAMEDDEIAAIHARVEQLYRDGGVEAIRASEIADIWNVEPGIPTLPDLMRQIAKVRRQGYSMSQNAVAIGAGIICVLLPTHDNEQPLGLGVAGLSTMIERDRDLILETIQAETAKLGVSLALPVRR